MAPTEILKCILAPTFYQLAATVATSQADTS